MLLPFYGVPHLLRTVGNHHFPFLIRAEMRLVSIANILIEVLLRWPLHHHILPLDDLLLSLLLSLPPLLLPLQVNGQERVGVVLE